MQTATNEAFICEAFTVLGKSGSQTSIAEARNKISALVSSMPIKEKLFFQELLTEEELDNFTHYNTNQYGDSVRQILILLCAASYSIRKLFLDELNVQIVFPLSAIK